MINPNKEYRQKNLARIIKIDSLTSYIPYVFIQDDVSGSIYEGSIKRVYGKPSLLKLGDTVSYSLQFSIMSDKFMISSLVRKRK